MNKHEKAPLLPLFLLLSLSLSPSFFVLSLSPLLSIGILFVFLLAGIAVAVFRNKLMEDK